MYTYAEKIASNTQLVNINKKASYTHFKSTTPIGK